MRKRNGKKENQAQIEIRLSADGPPAVHHRAQESGKVLGAADKETQQMSGNGAHAQSTAKIGSPTVLSVQAAEEVRLIFRQELASALLEHAQDNSDREWYTTAQFGKKVKRSRWWIRRCCELGKLNGVKVNGRGRHGEWRLSHEELLRFEREGYED